MTRTQRRQVFLHRTEARHLLRLAGPILTAQLAHQALAFTDTVMAGRVSAADLAGVAVGSSVWIPIFLFLYGVLLAVTPMTAQLFGAGRIGATGPLARRGLVVAVPLVVLAFILLHNADLIFSRMDVAPQVGGIAAAYLKAIAWGLPAMALFFLLRNLSEGLGLVRPSMLVGLASIPVNVTANYLLIYGKLGLPALGGVGCGWASCITLWFMAGCMLRTIWRMRQYSKTNFFVLKIRHPAGGARQLFRLGLPIGFALLVESSIFALIALFLAPLGALAVAAHQITLNYSSLIFMIPLSISSAMTIRVGHAVGRGRADRARRACRTGLLLNSGIALLTAALTLLCAERIAAVYTHDNRVIAVAVGLLTLNALYQVSDAIQVAAAGALRGYKDTRVPLLITVFAYWVIGLPLGYSLALTDVWGPALGARGFWISLIVGLSIAALLLGERLRRVARRAPHPVA